MIMVLRALLIGVNHYHPESNVRPLAGCQNDLNSIREFLNQHYSDLLPDERHIRVLFNEQATRDNVIAGFREHLALAGPDDTVLVYFSGHGAQSLTAKEFQPFVTDQQEEGWVLYDSRLPGRFDLADKEIALLLEEAGRQNPDIVVIADSCHSGSVTRDAEDRIGWNSRFIPGIKEPRPVESYLDGAYQKRLAEKGILEIPYTRHLLFAACDKTEVAWESDEKCGVFTRALLNALGKANGLLDYGEAFTQTCASIRLLTRQQNPQAEAIGGFNPRAGFLGKAIPAGRRKRYAVHTQTGTESWRIELGAADGLVSDMSEAIRVELFDAAMDGKSLGTATLTFIGATESGLEPEIPLNPFKTYWADPLKMPYAPYMVYCPDPSAVQPVQDALTRQAETAILLAEQPEGCATELRKSADGNFTLHHTGSDALIHGVQGTDEAAVAYLIQVLGHLAHYERIRKLDNPNTLLPRSTVQLGMFLQQDGAWKPLTGDKALLTFNGQRINFRLTISNQSGQSLYLALVYLDPRFGMSVLWHSSTPAPSGTTGLQVMENFFNLPPGVDEELDTLKLVVSTDPIEQSAFSRPPLRPVIADPRSLGGATRSIGGLSEPDWFAHTLPVHILRDSGERTQNN